MSELIDVYKLARLLNVSRRTVFRLVKRGVLPEGIKLSKTVRRWELDQVEAAINKLKQERNQSVSE